MRIPTSNSHQRLRQIIRTRSDTYDIERVSTSSGRFGETDQSTTTITGVELWVYDPLQTNVGTQFGERLGGDLQAVALPNADIQYDDRITHGAATYEVDTIVHKPDEDDQQYKLVAFTNVVN